MMPTDQTPWKAFRSAPLIAATFTPMHADGSVNIGAISGYVDALIIDGIGGLYVGGTTGEGQALTTQERMDVATAFIGASDQRIPVTVHVGHNSLRDARTLAEHASDVGAAAISAMLPTNTPPLPIDTRVATLEFIASAAPEMPFVFYHLASNGSADVVEVMQTAMAQIPSVAGVKFTDSRLHDLQACLEIGEGRLAVFFGVDEMLAGGLIAGAQSAIGSTYNFAAPLYLKVIEAVAKGDIAAATEAQRRAAHMIRVVLANGGFAAQKELMKTIGIDCGPCRLPQPPLSDSQRSSLRSALDEIGFHQWGR